MKTIFHKSREFREVELLITAAARCSTEIVELRRFPTFSAPALLFFVDFFEFVERFSIEDILAHKVPEEDLELEEMHLDIKKAKQRVLIFTAPPCRFCTSTFVHIDSSEISLLYDAECVFGEAENESNHAQEAEEMLDDDARHSEFLRHEYARILQSSKFNALSYAERIRKLNEDSIDAENVLFGEYKALLLDIQNRTQFIHNHLQAEKLEFQEQALRADKMLGLLTTRIPATDTLSNYYIIEERLLATEKLKYCDDDRSFPGEDELIQLFMEKDTDFAYEFDIEGDLRINYHFDPFQEREFANTEEERLLVDFQAYLDAENRLSKVFQGCSNEGAQLAKLEEPSQLSLVALREKEALPLTSQKASTMRPELKVEVACESFTESSSTVHGKLIQEKAGAVKRQFAQLLTIEMREIQEYANRLPNTLVLISYHFAKLNKVPFKTPKCEKIREFNASNMIIVLYGQKDIAAILVTQNEAIMYYNDQYFFEGTDVKVQGVQITCSAFEVRGKQLKLSGKAVLKFEKGAVYRLV